MARKLDILLLAAGFGTRLLPYTKFLPKCLMPVNGKPLLDIWLTNLSKLDFGNIYINVHYLSDWVRGFINGHEMGGRCHLLFEHNLLGTAGTVGQLAGLSDADYFLVAHADNLCLCDWDRFVDFHLHNRDPSTVMTMMTFYSACSEKVGLIDEVNGVVTGMREKQRGLPPGLANGAVYILERCVVEKILNSGFKDFSSEVIPYFLGKISVWENKQMLVDIGDVSALVSVQGTDVYKQASGVDKTWLDEYRASVAVKLIEHKLRKGRSNNGRC